MKLAALLIVFLAPLLVIAQPTVRNRFTTNADNVPINGILLTNIDYAKIVTPTTNNVYDVTEAFVTGLTTVNDGVQGSIPATTANGHYYSFQTQPRVLTNVTGGFLRWESSEIFSGNWIIYTNASAYVDRAWAGALAFGTNLDTVNTSTWIDGSGAGLANNTGQFKTNTVITYPQRNLVANYQTNLNIKVGTAGGSIELTNWNSANANSTLRPAITVVSGNNQGAIRMANVENPIGGPLDHSDTYFEIVVVPDHDGSASVANSETQLSANRFALVWKTILQMGRAETSGNLGAILQMQNSVGASASISNSPCVPVLFRVQSFIGNATQVHYPGIYAVGVTTNAPNGTYYVGLANKQSTAFDGEATLGAKYTIGSSNETFRAWGGQSNTFEVLVPAQFDGSVNAATNIAPLSSDFTLLTINQYYTNRAQRMSLDVDVLLNSDATHAAALALYIDTNGGSGGVAWNVLRTNSDPATIAGAQQKTFHTLVGPSWSYLITNLDASGITAPSKVVYTQRAYE